MGEVIGTIGLGAHVPAVVPRHLTEHYKALQNPRGFERAIVQLRAGLLEYALQYEDRFDDSKVGDDGVLGECWLQIARGYLGLLNGETGRLDCGTLDGEVRRWAERFGFEGEL